MSDTKSQVPADKLALYQKLVATRPDVELKGANMPYTSLNGHMFSFLTPTGTLALRLPAGAREAFIEKYETSLCVQHGRAMKSTSRSRMRCSRRPGSSRNTSIKATPMSLRWPKTDDTDEKEVLHQEVLHQEVAMPTNPAMRPRGARRGQAASPGGGSGRWHASGSTGAAPEQARLPAPAVAQRPPRCLAPGVSCPEYRPRAGSKRSQHRIDTRRTCEAQRVRPILSVGSRPVRRGSRCDCGRLHPSLSRLPGRGSSAYRRGERLQHHGAAQGIHGGQGRLARGGAGHNHA
jgi:hypothetical protein